MATASLVPHPSSWTGPTYNDMQVASVTGTGANILIRVDGAGRYRLVRDVDGAELQSGFSDQTTATARANAIVSAGLV